MQKTHESFSNDGNIAGPTITYSPSKKNSDATSAELLPMKLAIDAFDLIGKDTFEVTAELDVNNKKSLDNFKLFQDILVMAYRQGQSNPQ